MSTPEIVAGYETTYITRVDLSDEGLKALQDRLEKVVQSFKGAIVLTEDWGKRRLAYPIRKEARGHYTYLSYTGQGEVVQEIERSLRLNEHVLRFLSVNLDREFDAEAFKKRRAEVHAASKRREEAREARREERHGYGAGGDRGERKSPSPASNYESAGIVTKPSSGSETL